MFQRFDDEDYDPRIHGKPNQLDAGALVCIVICIVLLICWALGK